MTAPTEVAPDGAPTARPFDQWIEVGYCRDEGGVYSFAVDRPRDTIRTCSPGKVEVQLRDLDPRTMQLLHGRRLTVTQPVWSVRVERIVDTLRDQPGRHDQPRRTARQYRAARRAWRRDHTAWVRAGRPTSTWRFVVPRATVRRSDGQRFDLERWVSEALALEQPLILSTVQRHMLHELAAAVQATP